MKWVSVKDRLPEDGQRVLIRHTRGTWIAHDPETVNYVVAKFVRGKTAEECKKLGVYTFADVHGNNLVPYRWDCFGPDSFFGQDVDYWMPLPKPPESSCL